MKIVIIILSVIVALVVLFFVIKAISKPKINYKKGTTTQTKDTKNASQPEIKKVEGLVFEEKYNIPEEPVKVYPERNLRNLPSPFPKDFVSKKKKKTLAEQINELSPELKALILDKGLARKDIELKKSKKNWTCIP